MANEKLWLSLGQHTSLNFRATTLVIFGVGKLKNKVFKLRKKIAINILTSDQHNTNGEDFFCVRVRCDVAKSDGSE